MGNLQVSVSELQLIAREIEYAGLYLAQLKTKQKKTNKNALSEEQHRIQSFYSISFIMFRIESKIWLRLKRKQQDNVTHFHEKKQLMEMHPKGHLDFWISQQLKAPTVTIIKDLKENTLRLMKW